MVGQYIKSPMNYTGGKYKLLEHIIPSFPNDVENFVDLFAGGLNVGINVTADTIYANDQITYLMELYQYFQNIDITDILDGVKERIQQFGLSQTNMEGYNNLRASYNKAPNPLDLFVLTCYSFNHQIRFNNKYEFNTPFGKMRSSYNSTIEQNLINFCDILHKKNIVFSADDFRNFDFSKLSIGDLVYCDPPYLITNGSYNDGKRGFNNWESNEDYELLQLLDELSDRGVLFALSNVILHKGQINYELMEWSKKYNVIFLDKSYSNCSYHIKDRNSKTVEVLITNYE